MIWSNLETFSMREPYMKHLYTGFLFGALAWSSTGQVTTYNRVELLVVRPKVERPSTVPDSLYNPLKEVVVSAYRSVEAKRDVPQEIAVINRHSIQQSMAASTVDVLANQAGVSVQKSQLGGGSIVLRGMEANRVLLVVDGVRMNNLIYRSGHLQNAITVDPLALERIEVAFGPTSNAYGSDAMGGVIHFMTKTPMFSQTRQLHGQAYAKYSAALQSWVKHVELTGTSLRWGFFTSLTESDFGDMRGGKRINPFYGQLYGMRDSYALRTAIGDSIVANAEPWVQKGSGYTQYDFVQKVIYRARSDRRNT
ncbi:MAG TPA: hypothetical protein DCE58_01015, partial [Cryomorphaceae bacterium]|nr:hypothetical protein [Cryomorphaceae bacterium]